MKESAVAIIFIIILVAIIITYPPPAKEEKTIPEAGAEAEETDFTAESDENFSAPEEEIILPEEPEFTERRNGMAENQLAARDITNEKVLGAMRKIQRHRFVPEEMKEYAYVDRPLPIGYGQTISQPYVVALMTQALDVKDGEKVLEIGTGSGYQAAVLAELTENVYTIEIVPELAQSAEQHLKESGYSYVEVKNADGYFGLEEHAPFDSIIITAAVDHVPQPLIGQLKDSGRLILPLGSIVYWQILTLIHKRGEELQSEYITDVRFVPMTGEAQKGG